METIANWLDGHMLACPSKALAGITCPGCGFQRGLVDLLRGDLAGSWEHYPPLIPFLLTLLLLVFFLVSRYRFRLQMVVGAFFTTVIFVIVNYIYQIT